MIKKILVLGATGQLGAYTSVFLKEKGFDVVAAGRRTSDNEFFKTKQIDYIGNFILEDEKSFDILPKDIDIIVHLAGSMPAHTGVNPKSYIDSIIGGMVNLCEWMKSTNCRRIIFNTTPSDICNFFESGIPVKENAPRSFPKDGGDHAIYAIAKNAAVDILEHYKYAIGLSSCVFRHLTVYGYHPDCSYFLNGEKKILPWRKIIDNAIKGKDIEIWGDPTRKKELLYIKDFTLAIYDAIESEAEGIYNLSGYEPYTLENQIDGIIKVFGNKDTKKIFRPDKPNTPQNLLDSQQTFDVMHWKPVYTWTDACMDIKREMEEEPFCILWGKAADFQNCN